MNHKDRRRAEDERRRRGMNIDLSRHDIAPTPVLKIGTDKHALKFATMSDDEIDRRLKE